MNIKLLLEIILTFAKIGALSFGGGYAAIPIVEKEIVDVKGWMSASEFATIMAIDELTPGPVAINCATFVGNKMGGVIGGIAATFGNILPSIIIVLIVAQIYYKYHSAKYFKGALFGLRCMVVGLIAYTTLNIACQVLYQVNSIDWISIIISLVGVFILRKYKVDPIFITVGSGVIMLVISMIFK